MKKIICLVVIATLIFGALAHALLPQHTWHATLVVVDESGKPIPDAEVSILYAIAPPPGQSLASGTNTGLTDINGMFETSHQDASLGLVFRVQKSGYYKTGKTYEVGILGQPIDPSKLAVSETLVLKKIGQPIPMYARKTRLEIPDVDKPVGFDLVEYDWVAPYGKGKQSDFVFQAERRWASRKDFDSAVKLTFSNTGDGLAPVLVLMDQGSELHMPALAPLDGYITNFLWTLNHTPLSGWKKNDNEGQNYYFRVRTILDSNGTVKSALYGKIYGDFELDPINSKHSVKVFFQYYLNPEPNSRNVEFDPKQNLFKKLPFLEEVTVP